MDYTTLKANVLDRVGLPSTDGLAADASLGKAVNAAVQRYSTRRAWPWLYSEPATVPTVAGTATVATPTCQRILWVGINGDELERRQRPDLLRYGTLTTAFTGRPYVWAPGNSLVHFAPTPDAVYAVQFGVTLVEPALSSGTDVPLLPVQFHDYLVVMASRYIAVRRKDSELLAVLKDEEREWEAALDRAAALAAGTVAVRTRQDWGI